MLDRLNPISGITRFSFGLLLALLASLSMAHLFAGTESRTTVPLWFILVLYGLSRRYGVAVGISGALLAALVFAHFLFDPVGGWHVDDQMARRNLVWMIAGATAASYLLPPRVDRETGADQLSDED